jgi:hypothetical protein
MQDVYTESGIGLTRGNAFPASEVTKVSQDSRQLWLQQRPFQLKRSTSSSLAFAGHVCVILHAAHEWVEMVPHATLQVHFAALLALN